MRRYTSYIGYIENFIPLLYGCAIRNGYNRFKTTVIISDGATWLRNMAKDYFPDALHILNFFYLYENIYTFCKLYFKKHDLLAKEWSQTICDKIKAGKLNEILLKIKKIAEKYSIKPNLYTYICNNINNINYPDYLDKGYFIGSGAIESGNKNVLQSRLKRAGQRWNIETAQNMVTLRAIMESQLWETEVANPIIKMFS
jgi:hypothetical protein